MKLGVLPDASANALHHTDYMCDVGATDVKRCFTYLIVLRLCGKLQFPYVSNNVGSLLHSIKFRTKFKDCLSLTVAGMEDDAIWLH